MADIYTAVLHCRCELSVSSAELLKQYLAEARIRLPDIDGVHKLLDVVIHREPPRLGQMREKSRGSLQGTNDHV